MKSFELKNIKLKDQFWDVYLKLLKDVALPYQYQALNDLIPNIEPSYSVHNFKVASGKIKGEHQGTIFQDSDVAKWIEAVGFLLEQVKDDDLEQKADDLIDLIGETQMEDGYLNTYFQITNPKERFQCLCGAHELYCAGHFIEAGVAYLKGTGKDKLLKIVTKYADCIYQYFIEGGIKGAPGHPEIELALVKLYEINGQEKYLKLAKFFLDNRGQSPNYFAQEKKKNQFSPEVFGTASWDFIKSPQYNQSHMPIVEQSVPVGHAVRATYLYSGMIDVATKTGDEKLLQACQRLWNSTVNQQMYITGAIGASAFREAFTFAYDLPNDTMYAETCASIALAQFAKRMNNHQPDSQYGDLIERELYNMIIASMSLEGKNYFYVNPLEVYVQETKNDPTKEHVKPVRQAWFGVSCCPPNVARLLAQLASFIFSYTAEEIYINQFIGAELNAEINGQKIILNQVSSLPWDNSLKITVVKNEILNLKINIRNPNWSKKTVVLLNGQEIKVKSNQGYILIDAPLTESSVIEIKFDLEAKLYKANSQVRYDLGKVAIMRGPLVYALEEKDNCLDLANLEIISQNLKSENQSHEMFGQIVAVKAQGQKLATPEALKNELYYAYQPDQKQNLEILAKPYFLWGNRGLGSMAVWIRENIHDE